MELKDLNTKQNNTWCPGCPNNGILAASKKAIADLINEGEAEHKDFVLSAGIGCHAKIYDYLNISGYYSLHGRTLPPMLGMKIGNPNLKVLGFAGDGDTFEEGMAHFIHNCRYNADMTFMVHDNQVFALTVGQFTATTEKGYKGITTPLEDKTQPINPLKLALAGGATFVARGFALEVDHLSELMKAAIKHKGFAFIDILQTCKIFHDSSEFIKERAYKLEEGYDKSNYEQAMQKAQEWDYSLNEDLKIPLGIFYQTEKPTFEDKREALKEPWYQVKRKPELSAIINEFK